MGTFDPGCGCIFSWHLCFFCGRDPPLVSDPSKGKTTAAGCNIPYAKTEKEVGWKESFPGIEQDTIQKKDTFGTADLCICFVYVFSSLPNMGKIPVIPHLYHGLSG